MTDRRRPTVTGPVTLALAEGGSGATLLLLAGPLVRSLAGEPVDRRTITVARILGARQLLQGLVTLREPTRRALEVGAAVDGLHAASMLGASVCKLGPRKLTLTSGLLAAAFAGAAIAQRRRLIHGNGSRR